MGHTKQKVFMPPETKGTFVSYIFLGEIDTDWPGGRVGILLEFYSTHSHKYYCDKMC